jgi:hypothetical protein
MNIRIFCRYSLFPSWSGQGLISTQYKNLSSEHRLLPDTTINHCLLDAFSNEKKFRDLFCLVEYSACLSFSYTDKRVTKAPMNVKLPVWVYSLFMQCETQQALLCWED